MTVVAALSCLLPSCQRNGQPGKVPPVQGDYLGQAIPGDTARLFAPGIISTGMNDRDFAITLTEMRSSSAAMQETSGIQSFSTPKELTVYGQYRRCSNTVPTPVQVH